MNLTVVKTILTRGVHRKVLVAKKNSPHIFFTIGLVGSVTSTILACRATLKLPETLDEIQNDIKQVKGLKEDAGKGELQEYPPDQWQRDMGYVYGKAGIKLAKLYGPSIVIGVASIGALSGSHVQLTRRNNALMAAYAAVQEAYDNYRDRVRDEVGEKRELELYHGAVEETIKNEQGKDQKVTNVDPNKWSPYAKFFDEASPNWQKDPELNRMFVQCQQGYANNILQAKGHLFLNEVYDMLGLDRSRAGQVVGWIIGEEGDNYIDFGIFETGNSRFVNGWERSILLDFNVDGVIYDKI